VCARARARARVCASETGKAREREHRERVHARVRASACERARARQSERERERGIMSVRYTTLSLKLQVSFAKETCNFSDKVVYLTLIMESVCREKQTNGVLCTAYQLLVPM